MDPVTVKKQLKPSRTLKRTPTQAIIKECTFGGNTSEFTLVHTSRLGGDTPHSLVSLHRRFVSIVPDL